MRYPSKTTSSLLKAVLALVFLLSVKPVWAQTNWKLAADEDGIKVFTSPVADSKIKALKVEYTLQQTTLSQLTAVLMDIKNAPQWVYATKSCTILKQVSPAEVYYYSEISMPWPVDNRDFVAHLTATQNEDTKVVTIDGPVANGMVPLKKNVVRVEHSNGKWVLIPVGSNQVKIEYTLQVDPGGLIPAWIVNLFASEGPMHSFKKLKQQVQKPAYKNITLPYIRN